MKFKFKTRNVMSKGKGWNGIDYIGNEIEFPAPVSAIAFARQLAELFGEEIRVNKVGSLQGYYVQPKGMYPPKLDNGWEMEDMIEDIEHMGVLIGEEATTFNKEDHFGVRCALVSISSSLEGIAKQLKVVKHFHY